MSGGSKRKKPEYEFFQKIVLISWAAGLVWVNMSYLLAYLGRDANVSVTLAIITEVLGVTLSYVIYKASLKKSLNKHGLIVGADNKVRRVEDNSGIGGV